MNRAADPSAYPGAGDTADQPPLRRGHYSPKEHQQHIELAAFYPKITVGYAGVVTDVQHSPRSSVRRSARSGPPCPIRAGPSSAICTSRSTPTPTTTR
jgi:hypothetical protein